MSAGLWTAGLGFDANQLPNAPNLGRSSEWTNARHEGIYGSKKSCKSKNLLGSHKVFFVFTKSRLQFENVFHARVCLVAVKLVCKRLWIVHFVSPLSMNLPFVFPLLKWTLHQKGRVSSRFPGHWVESPKREGWPGWPPHPHPSTALGVQLIARWW